MARLGILQSTVLEYRLVLYRLLKLKFGDEIRVCCGRHDAKPGQVTPDEALEFSTIIQNRFLFRKRLLWQSDVVRFLGNVDVAIVDPNMRFISTVLLLCYRKFKGFPTVAWGHASGRSLVGGFIRRFYYARFSGIIAYTDSQREVLQEMHPDLPVWSAFNACLKADDCWAREVSEGECTDFVFVGRLSKQKKPELLIRAFIYAADNGMLPEQARLVIVGDDPDRERLQRVVAEAEYDERIIFHGFVHDVERLQEVYRRAIASVSPGYVGLSVTQSTGFGVPVIVARDEPHSPEIEVCSDGFNARFFPSDDIVALGELMSEFYIERGRWLKQRELVAEDTRSKYSFEKMFLSFCDVESYFRKGSE